MFHTGKKQCAHGRRLSCWGVAVVLWGAAAATVWADDGPRVVAVEEHWQLVVDQPDDETCSPQVTCSMSPSGNLNGMYFSVELNHRSAPEYSAGGVHVQLWGDGAHWDVRDVQGGQLLSHNQEVVEWTQVLSVENGLLSFRVTDASSQSWGHFGGEGQLHFQFASNITDLNGYNPEASVANSGVGYGANRVAGLVLKKVRAHLENGTVVDMDDPRAVYLRP